MEYFSQAVALDPKFSLAYAGIADTYALFAFYAVLPPCDVVPKARQAAEKAIAINPLLVEPYALLAFITTFYDRNWVEAKKQFENAISINSRYAPAHYWYSNYLSWVEKDFFHSVEEALKAIEVEPLISHSHITLASAYLCCGKFEEALNCSKTAIELDANSFIAHSCLSTSLYGLGKYAEAIEATKFSVNISGRHQYPLIELSWLYYMINDIPEAQKILDELMLRSTTEFISGLSLSVAAYASKNYDMVAGFLEKAFEERASFLVTIEVYPFFSFIKTDPRFHPFIERMKFPE